MAAKHKVTVSVQPTNPRPSSAQRRAAEIASLSTKQAELKQRLRSVPPRAPTRTLRQRPRRAERRRCGAATRADRLIVSASVNAAHEHRRFFAAGRCSASQGSPWSPPGKREGAWAH